MGECPPPVFSRPVRSFQGRPRRLRRPDGALRSYGVSALPRTQWQPPQVPQRVMVSECYLGSGAQSKTWRTRLGPSHRTTGPDLQVLRQGGGWGGFSAQALVQVSGIPKEVPCGQPRVSSRVQSAPLTNKD